MNHILLSIFCMLSIFSGAYAMEQNAPEPAALSLKAKIIKHALFISAIGVGAASAYYTFPQPGSNWNKYITRRYEIGEIEVLPGQIHKTCETIC